jgi:CBS domain-containing protein
VLVKCVESVRPVWIRASRARQRHGKVAGSNPVAPTSFQSFRLPFPANREYISARQATEACGMYTVKELLREKGNQVWSVAPQATVYEALELMAEKNIGALVVIEKENVVGIFTERDYARKVTLQGRTSKTTTIGELMTTDVLYVKPDETMENCMAIMTDKRLRHLLVMENNKLAGVVSIGDIVKAVISDREFTIRELERYITGGHSSLT